MRAFMESNLSGRHMARVRLVRELTRLQPATMQQIIDDHYTREAYDASIAEVPATPGTGGPRWRSSWLTSEGPLSCAEMKASLRLAETVPASLTGAAAALRYVRERYDVGQ
jgi:hypothetical protein